MPPITEAELDSRFGAHEVDADQRGRIGEMRAIIRHTAGEIVRLTPTGREQSYALTLLEHAGFATIAAISRETSA